MPRLRIILAARSRAGLMSLLRFIIEGAGSGELFDLFFEGLVEIGEVVGRRLGVGGDLLAGEEPVVVAALVAVNGLEAGAQFLAGGLDGELREGMFPGGIPKFGGEA